MAGICHMVLIENCWFYML